MTNNKTRNYVNYACGSWIDGITELRNENWNVYGFEPNLPKQHEYILTNIKELNNIEIDGIFTHNFIEHLQEPIDQFKEWNKLLKVGDLMSHSSACYKWKFDFSNFHVFYFLGKSLELLASSTGFTIVDIIEYKPDSNAEYTQIVIFQKISEVCK